MALGEEALDELAVADGRQLEMRHAQRRPRLALQQVGDQVVAVAHRAREVGKILVGTRERRAHRAQQARGRHVADQVHALDATARRRADCAYSSVACLSWAIAAVRLGRRRVRDVRVGEPEDVERAQVRVVGDGADAAHRHVRVARHVPRSIGACAGACRRARRCARNIRCSSWRSPAKWLLKSRRCDRGAPARSRATTASGRPGSATDPGTCARLDLVELAAGEARQVARGNWT